jgi:hypothetical protein
LLSVIYGRRPFRRPPSGEEQKKFMAEYNITEE